MTDDYANAACPICKGTEFQWGAMHAKGFGLKGRVGVEPKETYWTNRGTNPAMRVCATCGNIQLFLVEKP
ncbi:MAG: hypothetical protein HN742_30605 [Lentisphaerae bacterium]|jgi:hypothetical protein|nr:hypothetical protein [Lentisphaerota bacterium]MBT4820958.1 hypothetical protein [Lentisphaerota bacterium]MBT5612082.1 hypothetical protein [Lentisphaerota bacterium]MBT7061875.1 hypothetical protein [Lentisphaerota bacterium]MBT7846262.1 hypothetical protein [Lentisphaerota bacterium]